MYTIRMRLIGYVLLMSHSLMSCYNPDLVRDERRLTNRIQVEKEEEVVRIIQEHGESPQVPCKQSVSLSIHPILFEQKDVKAPKLTSSTKIEEAASLPGASGQVQKPLSISTNLFQGPGEAGEKETLQLNKDKPVAIVNNQVSQKNQAFHPLHPILKNRQGCQLQFTSSDLQAAEVKDLDGRTFHLPVFKGNPSLGLEQVMAKGEEWRKYHIYVTFPEQDPANKGYVYVGTRGLMGGGGTYSRGWEEHILLACRSCKKAIKTQLVWVEGYGMNPDNGSPHRWIDKCDACKNWDKWMEQLRQEPAREKREKEKWEREQRVAAEKERIERLKKEIIEREKKMLEERERGKKKLEENKKKLEELCGKVENLRKEREECAKKESERQEQETQAAEARQREEARVRETARERVSQQTNSNSSSKDSSNSSGKSKSGSNNKGRSIRISRPMRAGKKASLIKEEAGFGICLKVFSVAQAHFLEALANRMLK